MTKPEERPAARKFDVPLGVGFGILITLMALSGIAIVLIGAEFQDGIRFIQENYTESVRLIGNVQTEVYSLRVLVRDLAYYTDHAQQEALRRQIDSVILDISDDLTSTRRLANLPEEAAIFQQYIAAFDDYADAVREVIDSATAGKNDVANDILRRKMTPIRLQLGRISRELTAVNVHAARVTRDHVENLEREFKLMAVPILALSLVTSLFIYYRVSQRYREYDDGIRLANAHNEELLSLVRERQRKIGQLAVRMTTIEEDQRKYFAQELHDAIGHGLTTAKFHADTALAAIGRDDDRAAGNLNESLAAISASLAEAKRISYALRPTLLDDLGLVAAVSQAVTEFKRRSGIEAETEFTGVTDRLDPMVEITAYRMIQEALTNVERHAAASHLSLQILRRDDGFLVISIADDGKGFDVGEVAMRSSGGLGLRNILERGELLGGTVLIESRPGKGCEISIELPLTRKENAG